MGFCFTLYGVLSAVPPGLIPRNQDDPAPKDRPRRLSARGFAPEATEVPGAVPPGLIMGRAPPYPGKASLRSPFGRGPGPRKGLPCATAPSGRVAWEERLPYIQAQAEVK